MARVSDRPEPFCDRRPLLPRTQPVSQAQNNFNSPPLLTAFRDPSGQPVREHDGSFPQETIMISKTEQIRALNDALRQNLTVGTAFITAGVAALGAEAVARIVKTIAVYDDFCHANDPYEEHDFGSFEVDGQTIFFKIDYCDKTLVSHLPDPTDPVTERVITIMLAEEY
jgi:Protein of unknown function (DUF3768)